ncbi:hypothetical protein ACQ4PT_004285 [Festuca glaucescens]
MAALRAVWLGRDQGFEALNEALITLLPKKAGATELKDFRPISLVHSFARLLTKVLARRLAPRMHELVDKNQTAFIRDRCIQDNFLLVKESGKLLHHRNIPSLLLKVDVAKAFDSISWPFLFSVLRQRGFGRRWLRWIALLLRSASTSVLVNGSAGDAFRHGRGLRQGDPISPLLFGIAMDVLSAMFRTAERSGFLADLSAIGLHHRVSLYADDIVIFTKPDPAELAAVWEVLGCFGMTSGLRANFTKSSAAPIHCSEDMVAAVAQILPCPLAMLPCTYLGLPLSIGKPRKAELQVVLDKLAAKLPFWKAHLMTHEGRLVYIQAVMTASVVYQLLALDLDPCKDSLALFNASVRIDLGAGASVLFWEDAWINGLTAAAIAPSLLECVRPAVRRRRSVQDGLTGNSWALDISGTLTIDVVVQYLRLWAAVGEVHLDAGDTHAPDNFRWKWRGDDQFTSRTAYRMLFHGTTSLPSAPLVWHSFAPLKYKMHAWLALRRRCWTADRRLRRGLPSHTLCPLCDTDDETLDHISLHCDYARAIWAGLIHRLGLLDISPAGAVGINDWWLMAAHRFAPKERKKANSLIMLTLRGALA